MRLKSVRRIVRNEYKATVLTPSDSIMELTPILLGSVTATSVWKAVFGPLFIIVASSLTLTLPSRKVLCKLQIKERHNHIMLFLTGASKKV